MEHSTGNARRPDGLEMYLRRHWLLARNGTELATRLADVTPHTELRVELGSLAREVAGDCSALLLSLASAGVRPAFVDRLRLGLRERLVWAAPGRSQRGRTGLDDVTDLEALAGVLVHTRLGWDCIQRLALDDPWWSHYAAGHWLRRNAEQQALVDALHPAAVAAAFALSGTEFVGVSRPAGTAGP
jgi:hypothetical protein